MSQTTAADLSRALTIARLERALRSAEISARREEICGREFLAKPLAEANAARQARLTEARAALTEAESAR